MRTSILTTAALLACCFRLYGQGDVALSNLDLTNRLSIDVPGNLYSGVFGMEAWWSGNTNPSLSGVLDLTATTNSLAAYQLLAGNGFTLGQSYVASTLLPGLFDLGVLYLQGVTRPDGTVTLALVAWNSSAPNWAAAIAAGAKGGLIAFVQPTADFTSPTPPIAPVLNWTVPQDLVMISTVPEPGAFPLVAFGAAVLLLTWKRRSKGHAPDQRSHE